MFGRRRSLRARLARQADGYLFDWLLLFAVILAGTFGAGIYVGSLF